ncbi:MAG: aspartate carbamoyltransferase catalytic subunit [Planctomycetota bacterium]
MNVDRHLLGLRGMPTDRLRALLASADRLADSAGAADSALAGRTVATLFFEDSTRTRMSFSLAATRLGAHVVDLSASSSSVAKGESLIDTAKTVEAMGVDAFVVRTGQSGGPSVIAGAVSGPVLNAGDGQHEHPTQGLLDTLAIARAHGRADGFDLSGLTVAIVGDCAHSRVARSDAWAMTALGARVILCGPPRMAPAALGRALGCEVITDLDDVISEVDAVQMLRVQFERGARVASPRQYRAGYALTTERAVRMKAGAVVMHPGPMNRGIELDGPVADSDGSGELPESLVLEQVRLGIAVRMAALTELFAATLAVRMDRPAHAASGAAGVGPGVRV